MLWWILIKERFLCFAIKDGKSLQWNCPLISMTNFIRLSAQLLSIQFPAGTSDRMSIDASHIEPQFVNVDNLQMEIIHEGSIQVKSVIGVFILAALCDPRITIRITKLHIPTTIATKSLTLLDSRLMTLEFHKVNLSVYLF